MISIENKACLTINEASEYSNIGIVTLQRITKDPECPFVFRVGKKKLIKRKKFDRYLDNIRRI